MNIVVLDFETGGLDPEVHALMSVAAITLNEKLETQNEYYAIIKDTPDRIVTEGAVAVNGITDKILQEEGFPIDVVLFELRYHLKDAIICCHNAAFDVAWLNNRGFNIQEAIDTMFLSWRKWGKYSKAKLGIVCERAGIKVQDAHNSLGDARMTAELLRYLAKENPEYLIPEPIRWRWWEK